LNLVAQIVVVGSWLVFAAFVLRKRGSAVGPARGRDPASRAGIGLQATAYALAWWARRAPATPLFGSGALPEGALALLASGLAVFSVWLALRAIRTLGREWSLEARVLEGHRLVAEGPYAYVRHPIYAAMLGMLVATGLVVSRPGPLGLAVGVFLAGTWIRVRAEERLLAGACGAGFEAYRRRVPALLPMPRRRAG
jgi:protein-S-isoprenylcysteine O-methyltransferase Ste14